MKIILLQDIKNLGKKGDIKEVSDGYGRNFLLPKKLAEIATPENIKKAEAEKAKQKQLEQLEIEKSKVLANNFKNLEIIIKAPAKDGKLFGSVITKDIAKELKKRNFDIQEKNIKIEEAIKKIGDYKIKIELPGKITAEFKLIVEGLDSHVNKK